MGDCLGLIIVLVFAAIAGGVADMLIPGKMPYGWIGGIIVGMIGGIIGSFLPIGGPSASAFGITYYIIPGIIGAVIFAFLARFLMGQTMGRRG